MQLCSLHPSKQDIRWYKEAMATSTDNHDKLLSVHRLVRIFTNVVLETGAFHSVVISTMLFFLLIRNALRVHFVPETESVRSGESKKFKSPASIDTDSNSIFTQISFSILLSSITPLLLLFMSIIWRPTSTPITFPQHLPYTISSFSNSYFPTLSVNAIQPFIDQQLVPLIHGIGLSTHQGPYSISQDFLLQGGLGSLSMIVGLMVATDSGPLSTSGVLLMSVIGFQVFVRPACEAFQNLILGS